MTIELMTQYVKQIEPLLASVGIKVELVTQREWQGATHYALDLRRGQGKAYRFRDWVDLTSSDRAFQPNAQLQMVDVMVRFVLDHETEDRALAFLVNATPNELDLVQQIGERGYLKIPNGELINPHFFTSFLEEMDERTADAHPFLPYARLFQAGLAERVGTLMMGAPELHITDAGRMAKYLLKEGVALQVLARFGRMFHAEMRKKYPQMNRDTKVEDIRLPKPTPPSWRSIAPGVGEIVLRFDDWRSSAGEHFRVAYVPETNTVYVPMAVEAAKSE